MSNEYDSGSMHDGCGGEFRERQVRQPDGSFRHIVTHSDGSFTVDGERYPPGYPQPGTAAFERKMYGG